MASTNEWKSTIDVRRLYEAPAWLSFRLIPGNILMWQSREQHAATFAASLAVRALQTCCNHLFNVLELYDQLIHDIAIQNSAVLLLLIVPA